jgi:hypothetical protein
MVDLLVKMACFVKKISIKTANLSEEVYRTEASPFSKESLSDHRWQHHRTILSARSASLTALKSAV